MARRKKIWKVETEGRDKGKRFLLTEMPSSQAESWAYRAILALVNNNVQLPENFEATGMAGLAQIGLRGLVGLPWMAAEPLLREMLSCVQICPDPKRPDFARDLEPADGEGDYDIEEITTRMNLRLEVLKLHMDFSAAAVQSLVERVKGAAGKGSNTKTESPK